MAREIVLKEVWFRYSKGGFVLKGISVKFSKGISLVTGPNGSGKTTLLKVASFIYRPTRGFVYIDGLDFWSLSLKDRYTMRMRVAYVHEKPILVRGKGLDNVVLGLRMRGIGEREAVKRAVAMLRDMGLEHLKSKRRLSSGEAQLVCIIRALLPCPDYIMLDEPFAHLDREKRSLILNHLEGYAGDKVIVIATNNPMAFNHLGKVVMLENGEVVKRGGWVNEC